MAYISKSNTLPGSSYSELMAGARREYHLIQKRTPRRAPYVRSQYFIKSKVFINAFWDHLKQKHPADQERRLKFFACGLDLIRNTREAPTTVLSKDNPDLLLHRFYGKTNTGKGYCVQIKENKRNNRKDFMSVFPQATTKKASR